MVQKLTGKFVSRTQKEGLHSDGHGGFGLCLQVRKRTNGEGVSKSWIQRLAIRGKRTRRGLGPYPVVTLAKARKMALANYALAYEGAELRKRDNGFAIESKAPSFADCFRRWYEENEPTWAASSARAVRNTVEHHGKKLLDLPVDTITPAMVGQVLTPIWLSTPSAGRRLKANLRKTFGYAVRQGYRSDNPADGELALPRQPRGTNHGAMPYTSVPSAFVRIGASGAFAETALCLQFTILTACRSMEAMKAEWGEIDLEEKVWEIPAARTKTNTVHAIPLSEPALAILVGAWRNRTERANPGEFVFHGERTGAAMAKNAMSKCLNERAGLPGTVHGLRSCFETWAAEKTNFDRDVYDSALSHKVGNKVTQAYLRTTFFDKRRALMDEWGKFVA